MAIVGPFDCGICGDPVIGLMGQDAVLPPYVDGPDVEKLAEKGATGCVHASCLKEQDLGDLWTSVIVKLLATDGATNVVFEAPDLVILAHKTTGDKIILSHGTEARFSEKDLDNAKVAGDLISIPLQHEMSLDLRHKPEFLADFRKGLLDVEQVPLLKLVDALNVTKRLIQPEALSDGKIFPLLGDREETFEELDEGYLSATARYSVVIPTAARDALAL